MPGRNLFAPQESPAPKGRNLLAVEKEQPEKEEDSLLSDAVDVAQEFAAAVPRGVTEGIDFLSGGVNYALDAAGVDEDVRLPSLTRLAQEQGLGVPGYMEPGVARDIVQTAGEFAPGVVGVAAQAKGIPTLFSRQSPFRQKIEELAISGSREINKLLKPLEVKAGVTKAAGKMIDPKTNKVVKDVLAKEAIRQGFSDGAVASIKRSSPKTRERMSEMIDVLERGRADSNYEALHRPADIAGDVLAKRFRVIRDANRSAGSAIDREAKNLAGKQVDVSPALQGFFDDLAEIGVAMDREIKPVFKNSYVEGVEPAERIIKKVAQRVRTLMENPSAEDAHKLKRFIDEHVSYGKNSEGLSGSAERVVKNLRRQIDQALDSEFAGYKKANDEYAETINAMNAFQDIAGRKTDLSGENADKAIGLLSRRIMGNAASRTNLIGSIDELERVAGKYGADTSENVVSMAILADDLEKLLPRGQGTNLAKEIEKGARQGVREYVIWGPTGLLRAGVDTGVNYLRGIGDEEAILAMKKLLNRPSVPK